MDKHKESILIIEDEMVNRYILKSLLEREYDILEAANGLVGLQLAKREKEHIAAILLDLTMPVMNGYEFLEAIKDTALSSIPVIVMTGSDDEKTEQDVLQNGAWDFLPKPYSPIILNVRLENAIARSKMTTYKKIKHLSEHDPLTGLYNRRKFYEATYDMIKGNPDREYAFVTMDLDGFGLYNSSFGEKAGDNLLRYCADLLRKSATWFTEVVYGRFGSDIFCLCTPFDGDKEKLESNMEVAQSWLNNYSKNYVLKVSSGTCIFEGSEVTLDNFSDVYLRASRAAKKCKQHYNSIMEFSDEDARQHISDEIAITNEMARALAKEEFKVYFQPKYELKNNTCCGAEALVRWQHPEKGLVSPGFFIPLFERNGFIAKLDFYVWEHTCKCLRKWLDDGKKPSPVSVNVSRISLYNANLDRLLVNLMEKYNLPTSLLELEITESAYMSSPELMHELIRKLHNSGFTILMDDFGSDYSSLNTLKDIEVDILKIDMAFIPQGYSIEKGEIILASIIKMAQWLGIPVIVEGVENQKQRDYLEGVGCEMIQGYYFARPMPADEYEVEYVYVDKKKVRQMRREERVPFIDTGTILIVDDSEMTCEILKSYFENSYKVECCASAEEALVYLKRNPDTVKLMLVDNIMPEMSGLDFLRFCKQDKDLSGIPKVMITASNNVADHLAAFQEGAYDFIPKPFTREIVVARVRHIMDTAYHYTNYDKVKLEYAKDALRDAETKLLTNASFCALCDRMINTFPGDPMALLKINMDDFAKVNETFGYEKGTEILARLAAELKATFRRCDVVGRVGGDEFAIMLCGIPSKKIASGKSNEVNRLVSFIGAKEYGINLSASIGLVYPVRADTIETIIAKADQALLEAKHSRKGIYVIYGESVPPVEEGEDKPLVLVCGGDHITFKEVALSYGDSAGFLYAKELKDAKEAFEKYGRRIAVVCGDMNTRIEGDRDAFYSFILERGGGTTIPMLGICKLGDINQMKLAVSREVSDILPLPIQPDLLQSQLSLLIMKNRNVMTRRSTREELR